MPWKTAINKMWSLLVASDLLISLGYLKLLSTMDLWSSKETQIVENTFEVLSLTLSSFTSCTSAMVGQVVGRPGRRGVASSLFRLPWLPRSWRRKPFLGAAYARETFSLRILRVPDLHVLQRNNDLDKASSSHRFSASKQTNNQQAALKIYHCHFAGITHPSLNSLAPSPGRMPILAITERLLLSFIVRI